jgi:hypothetical protein
MLAKHIFVICGFLETFYRKTVSASRAIFPCVCQSMILKKIHAFTIQVIIAGVFKRYEMLTL